MAEIRIPLYGMVSLSKMEWEIVNSKPFQRLRRIKQLAFSDFVYPGAVHTRFEHCIGVLYLASQAFDRICAKDHVRRLMRNVLGSDDVAYSAERVHRFRRKERSHSISMCAPIPEESAQSFVPAWDGLSR